MERQKSLLRQVQDNGIPGFRLDGCHGHYPIFPCRTVVYVGKNNLPLCRKRFLVPHALRIIIRLHTVPRRLCNQYAVQNGVGGYAVTGQGFS